MLVERFPEKSNPATITSNGLVGLENLFGRRVALSSRGMLLYIARRGFTVVALWVMH